MIWLDIATPKCAMFFSKLIPEIKKHISNNLLVTTRCSKDYTETKEILDKLGIQNYVIGEYGGNNKKDKFLARLNRNEEFVVLFGKLGYYVIITGNNENDLGHKFSNLYMKADYSNKDEILHIMKDYNIDYIVPSCNDFSILTASYVMEQLNLKYFDSFELTKLIHYKDLFRKFTMKNNIPAYVEDKKYIDFVKRKAKNMFKNNVIILDKKLPFEEYNKLLSNIYIALFAHNRQQSFGNILTLLGFDKCVYVYYTSIYKFFKSKHIEIYDIKRSKILKRKILKNSLYLKKLNFLNKIINDNKNIFDYEVI